MGVRIGSRGRFAASLAALGVAGVALTMPGPAGASGVATTFTVTGLADGPSSASCTAPDANGNSVCPTLRAAVTQAGHQTNHPTIYLQAGTFQLTLVNGGQLDLASSMDLTGAGPGGSSGTTIQQTDGQNRVLQVDGSTKLSGLEITGGHLAPSAPSGATWRGGGILVQSPSGVLTLQDVLVSGNQVVAPAGSSGQAGDGAEGGGIAYAPGTPAGSAISDSTITGNSVVGGQGGQSASAGSQGGDADGGGIAYEAAGALAVQSSTINGNAATGGNGGTGGTAGGNGGTGEGAGIFNLDAITVTASTIAANSAHGGPQGSGPGSMGPPPHSGGGAYGGGIFTQGATDEVVNSTLFGNAAFAGSPPPDLTTSGGGGIDVAGSNSGLMLQSDTIAANLGTFDGNLAVANIAPPNPFTIQDTVVAGGSPTNCAIGTPSSESYNLEDDAAGQCRFSGTNHDLVGVSPLLPSSLGSNGGATQTLAPAPGSPVLGAGGSCLDPTSTPPNQPLTVDQRGEPRSSTCDIGSFQAQRPANTSPPVLSGRVKGGQTLICSQGTWTGDGTLVYSFGWLRNGVPIAGATTNTYVVSPADAGQTLACQVTASYYGARSTATPFVIVPSYPVITVLRVSSSPTALTVDLGCRGVDLTRCRGWLVATVGTSVRAGRVIAVSAPRAGRNAVTLGQAHYSLLARHVATIRIHLWHRARRLLKRFRRLPSLLTVSQTTPATSGTVASLGVKIQAPRRQ